MALTVEFAVLDNVPGLLLMLLASMLLCSLLLLLLEKELKNTNFIKIKLPMTKARRDPALIMQTFGFIFCGQKFLLISWEVVWVGCVGFK